MSDSIGVAIEAIFGVFIAAILVWALYPVLAQLNAGLAVLFAIAGILIIGATIIGIFRGS